MKIYSTKETAEILGCTSTTIRAMVERGELGTTGYTRKKMPGRRRKIKIGEKNIADYIKKHSFKYSEDIIKRFCPDAVEESAVPPVTSPEIRCNPESAYLVTVNGRIAIGNVRKETALEVLTAIMRDPICCIDSVSISIMPDTNE